MNAVTPTVPLRVALYLRVSTARQAEHDISIPDQRSQGEAYCTARGYQLVETFVEPGALATNDRRPEFQRVMEAGTVKPPAFDMIVVHSFSRFFRDHFELEVYVRKHAKSGVKLVSMTQELGEDPIHVMMRQIMALFDEYQSKENAKHTLRALKENARQGFWNGSLPPIGYRVVDAEKRGTKVKKKLEIDPLHADTVRLAFSLAIEGHDGSGPMDVKAITKHLNERKLYTRTGGRWSIGAVHRMLTRTSYIGVHEFNRRTKHGANKPDDQVIGVEVPRLLAQDTWDRVQELLRSRNPKVAPPQVVAGPTLLTGICFCADCRGAMTIRTGKSGRYRCYTCSIAARQGVTGCKGRSIPMEKLDGVVTSHLEERLLEPERLEEVLGVLLGRREDRAARKRAHATEMRKRAAEADGRLKRLYDAIESGVADLGDGSLKERIAELRAIKSQAEADAKRAAAEADTIVPEITPAILSAFAAAARRKLRGPDVRFRRDHLRALAEHVEVANSEVSIMGSRSELLRQLAIANGVATAAGGVPRSVPKWRRGWDSNPRYP